MSARAIVVDALGAEIGTGLLLDGARVVPYARNIDAPAVPTVMVMVQEVEPTAGVPQARWDWTFTLVLTVPQSLPGGADDALEGLLQAVLLTVEKSPGLVWSKAARTVLSEDFPSFDVTVNAVLDTKE